MPGIQKLPKRSMKRSDMYGIVTILAFVWFIVMILLAAVLLATLPYSGYGVIPGILALVSLLISYWARKRKP